MTQVRIASVQLSPVLGEKIIQSVLVGNMHRIKILNMCEDGESPWMRLNSWYVWSVQGPSSAFSLLQVTVYVHGNGAVAQLYLVPNKGAHKWTVKVR